MDTYQDEQMWEMPPRKRQRSTSPADDQSPTKSRALSHDHNRVHDKQSHTAADEHSMTGITATKLLNKTSAPFLARHIPTTYNAHNNVAMQESTEPTNTKFCYRHRPDMLCRRQADEPTMDLLQKGLDTLSHEDRQAIVQVWSLFSAAPSKHRNLMLQGILTQCCFPQLSFLSAQVQKLIKIDFLAALPAEVSMRILCFLDTTSLCKAAQVSRRWRQLADDDIVWHRMCEQHIDRKCTKCGWGLPLMDQKRLRATKRQMQLRAAGKSINTWSPAITPIEELNEETGVAMTGPVAQSQLVAGIQSSSSPPHPCPAALSGRKTRPWKDVYRDRYRVGSNWKYGRYRLNILKGHTNGVMALQIFDNFLATGSYDATIKIWDLTTGECLRTLSGHTMGIRCLQMDETTLFSGCMDGTVKVWNWRTGACIATHQMHERGVIGLHHEANILATASADGTAKVFCFKGKTYYTLKGHADWVNSIRMDLPSRTIFTASDDFTVKMWDMNTKRCIRTFEGHSAHVQQIVVLPRGFEPEHNLVDEISEPGSPSSQHTDLSSQLSVHHISPVMSVRSNPLSRRTSDAYLDVFDGHKPPPPPYILTSGLDNTIRLWDVAANRCIRTFLGHVEGVWAIAADTLRIVSGSEDRMLKLWDPRSEKCERTITGHVGPVTCVGLSDNRMVSGGEDGEIRVYCFSDFHSA